MSFVATCTSTSNIHQTFTATSTIPSKMNRFKKLVSRNPSSAPNADLKSSVAQRPSWQSNVPVRPMATRRPQPQSQLSPSLNEPPPPAYTPNPNSNDVSQPIVIPIATPQVAAPGEDSPYAFLKQFDTIFLIDDSGSMAGRSWRETSQALGLITPICTEHDADGIDIFFLNHRNRTNSGLGGYNNVTTTSAVAEIFMTVRPSGGTPTGTRLNHILRPYLAEVEADMKKVERGQEPSVKPLNIIVITDGVPSDDVESVIVQTAKKLDKMNAEPWQVGVQFFQVGHEPEAADELRELDDALAKQHNIRDMVDTVPWSGEDNSELSAPFVLKVVMGSINRRLDRRRV